VFSIRFCANHEGTVKASNFGRHVNFEIIFDFSVALANMKTQMKKVKVVIKNKGQHQVEIRSDTDSCLLHTANSQVPHNHLLLDSAPNIGPLISRWELDKFKIC
jgi:hypothetical protein